MYLSLLSFVFFSSIGFPHDVVRFPLMHGPGQFTEERNMYCCFMNLIVSSLETVTSLSNRLKLKDIMIYTLIEILLKNFKLKTHSEYFS